MSTDELQPPLLNYHGPKPIDEAKLDGSYRWSPSILRALRSRYIPHMGLKQQTKLLRRQSALIPNTP